MVFKPFVLGIGFVDDLLCYIWAKLSTKHNPEEADGGAYVQTKAMRHFVDLFFIPRMLCPGCYILIVLEREICQVVAHPFRTVTLKYRLASTGVGKYCVEYNHSNLGLGRLCVYMRCSVCVCERI